MGFLDGLARGLKGTNNEEILNMYDEEDEDNYTLKKPKYRDVCMENTESNNGWYTCIKCHKKFRKSDMDVDHIIPQSKGGDSSKYNLQCICKHCNRSKQDDTSDTEKDLARRKRELQEQRKRDDEFLTIAQNEMKKNKQKTRRK